MPEDAAKIWTAGVSPASIGVCKLERAARRAALPITRVAYAGETPAVHIHLHSRAIALFAPADRVSAERPRGCCF